MNTKQEVNTKELGEILLDVAELLMNYGASSNRIRLTVSRISESYGYQSNLLIINTAITIFLNKSDEEIYNSLRRASPPMVNFRIVSGISRMSWSVAESIWTLDQIRAELKRLKSLPHYNRWLVLSLVSLAGASFCRIFEGNALEMAVAFVATFVGLFVRQELIKHKLMLYVTIYIAAFAASFVAGAAAKFFPQSSMEHAFAASVLFLIPGVPLINSSSDVLDGNILTGLSRGINALIIGFAISLGILTTTLIFN